MKIAYIRKKRGGFILCEDVRKISRERNLPVHSIRMEYPTPQDGKKATGKVWERVKKARNQRKNVRRRMATRVLFTLWYPRIYVSRRQAHVAAAALGCTHTSWRGKLSQCPSQEQLGIKSQKGQIDKIRQELLINP